VTGVVEVVVAAVAAVVISADVVVVTTDVAAAEIFVAVVVVVVVDCRVKLLAADLQSEARTDLTIDYYSMTLNDSFELFCISLSVTYVTLNK